MKIVVTDSSGRRITLDTITQSLADGMKAVDREREIERRKAFERDNGYPEIKGGDKEKSA